MGMGFGGGASDIMASHMAIPFDASTGPGHHPRPSGQYSPDRFEEKKGDEYQVEGEFGRANAFPLTNEDNLR